MKNVFTILFALALIASSSAGSVESCPAVSMMSNASLESYSPDKMPLIVSVTIEYIVNELENSDFVSISPNEYFPLFSQNASLDKSLFKIFAIVVAPFEF